MNQKKIIIYPSEHFLLFLSYSLSQYSHCPNISKSKFYTNRTNRQTNRDYYFIYNTYNPSDDVAMPAKVISWWYWEYKWIVNPSDDVAMPAKVLSWWYWEYKWIVNPSDDVAELARVEC